MYMAGSKTFRYSYFLISVGLVGLAALLYLSSISGRFFGGFEAWDSTYHNTSTVADFNGDGLLDIVIAHARSPSESTVFAHTTLWTNLGQGRFASERIAHSPSAAAGDVDRDGDIDIVTTAQWQLEVLLNQGGLQEGAIGTFEPYGNPIRPEGKPGTAGSVLLADLDGDGGPDGFVASGCSPLIDQSQAGVAASYYLPSYAWVWLNDWDPPGWLNRQTQLLSELGDLHMRAALGDLDGDGSVDVFAGVKAACPGGYDGHPDLVLLNDGQGKLRDSGQRLGDVDSQAVALGDLDVDGDLDALVGTPDGTLVWINQGGAQLGQAGQFVLSDRSIPSGNTVYLFLADFDGDGNLDALIVGERQARIWWTNGQGDFNRGLYVMRYSQRHGLAVGDLDGDGHPDVFAGAYNDNYVTWLNNGDGTFRLAGR
jgi:hypothetical protein